MITERARDLGGVSIQVAQGPANGPPLVLLHGVVRRWTDFVALLPSFLPRWEVHAVDFRGHGGSARTPGRYGVVDYVPDIVALLHSFDQPAAVYGHSLGAIVALAAAAAAPDKVRALVLEDPPFHTMGRDILGTPFHGQFAGLTRIVRPGRTVAELSVDLAALPIQLPGTPVPVPLGQLRDAPALRYMASCLVNLDPEVLAPIVAGEWLEGYDGPSLAASVRCPALVLEADLAAGGMLTPADSQWLASLLPECATVRHRGVGHLLHWLAPDAVLRSALAWLESTRP